MIRMTAMVSSMGSSLLRAGRGAVPAISSNRCATSPSVRCALYFVVIVQVAAALFATAVLAGAQEPEPAQPGASTDARRATSVGLFLGGAVAALGAHESGHLLFDGIFDAHPGIKKVSFHGLPFFAITHNAGLSGRREFIIDSAGFWVQEATNELILLRRPRLRDQHAPFVKGAFAFNVLASIGYAGAAFARSGPIERDTRGMADSVRWKEPYVGVLILIPAVLDAVRYYHPEARWAAWGSRAAKAGGVALIAR
jgi:hypothetical protein